MNHKVIIILRWIIFIPASIVLSLIYAIYIHPLLMQGVDKRVAHALNTLIVGVIAITASYIIAPKHKFRSALIVAATLLLVPVACIIIIVFGIKVNGEEQTIVDGGAAMAMLLIGIIVGVFVTWILKTWRQISQAKDSRIIRRIDRIEGLRGMTVNERLYASGLYDEFYTVINTDKIKARKILTWLQVDEPSIEMLLEQE